MALSPWWAFNTALGNSEGLLAAAVLWAVVAHLSGRHRAALALLTAAALMRPEAWPFLGVYGVWLWRRDPADRLAVVLAGALDPAAVVRPGHPRRRRRARRLQDRPRHPQPGQRQARFVPGARPARRHRDALHVPGARRGLIAACVRRPHRAAAGRGRRGLGRDRGGHDGRGLRRQPALPRRGRRARSRARGSGSRPRRDGARRRAAGASRASRRARLGAAPARPGAARRRSRRRSAPPCSSPRSSPSRWATCATSRPSSPRAPRRPAPSTARSPPRAAATRSSAARGSARATAPARSSPGDSTSRCATSTPGPNAPRS